MRRSAVRTFSEIAVGIVAIVALLIAVPALGGGTDKVTLCHISTDYPYAQTITVGEPALTAHLTNHHDYLGACATIEVRKVTDPASDPGKFDLRLNGATVATDVGNGGTSYPRAVLPTSTTNWASEAAGTGTTLANYNSSFVCVKGATTVASGTGTATPHTLAAQAGKNIVCTFTNQRKANVELRKSTVPADGSVWDFVITNGAYVTYKTFTDEVTPFTSGSVNVDPTNVEVDEWGGTGTSLTDYKASVACTDNGTPFTPAASGSYLPGEDPPTRVFAYFPVADGHSYVCTFTNSARATVQVKKDTDPSADGSKWNFVVTNGNDATYKTYADQAVPFDTGALEILGAANIEIDEWAGTGTTLDNYAAAVVCTDDGAPMALTAPSPTYYDAGGGQIHFYAYFPVAPGHAYVCTFTNTHDPYAGELVLGGSQQLGFTGMAAPSAGAYVYVNGATVDYAGAPSCVDADSGAPTTLRFAYQIPPGEPGLSGLWIVWKVTGGASPTAGFSVAANGTDAATKCGDSGFVPAATYPVVSSTLNF